MNLSDSLPTWLMTKPVRAAVAVTTGRVNKWSCVVSFVLGLALMGAAGGTVADPAVGLWSNPKGSLQVRTHRCGAQLCATVVGASARKLAKAQAAGINGLIGTELFSNYRPDGDGDWAGTLYVPDQGKRVSSTLQTNQGKSLKVSGCLIGRLLCKSQTWVRVDRVAQR